jgi:hypothetical protein
MELLRFGDFSEHEITADTFKGLMFIGSSSIQNPAIGLVYSELEITKRSLSGKEVIVSGPIYAIGMLCNDRDEWGTKNVWYDNPGATKTWLKFELKNAIKRLPSERLTYKVSWWQGYNDQNVSINVRTIVNPNTKEQKINLFSDFFRSKCMNAVFDVSNFQRFRLQTNDSVTKITFNNGRVVREITSDDLQLLWNTPGKFSYDEPSSSMNIKVEFDGQTNTAWDVLYMIDGRINSLIYDK